MLHELGFCGEINPTRCEPQQAISHDGRGCIGSGVHRLAGQRSIVIRSFAVRAAIADDVHLRWAFPAMRHRASTINVPLIN